MTGTSPRLPQRPYLGIEPFRYADQPIFFGRELESERLLQYITIYRGVLLYGPSGVGKSSMVNAGLIPLAITEGFSPERIRLQPRPGGEIIVERIYSLDGKQTCSLPSAFIAEQDKAASRVISVEEFRSLLHTLDKAVYPLLIFDQFEEFISLFEEAPEKTLQKKAAEVQRGILELLAELTLDGSLRVKLIYAFREDYLAKLGKLFARCPNLPDNYLRLTSLRVENLLTIIRGPFEKFPDSFEREISPRLAEKLASAIAERSGSPLLNLSEVQIACLRLWQSDDPERQFAGKGVQGLLEDYLSDSLAELPVHLRDPSIGLLSRMVTDTGLRNVVSQEDLIGQVAKQDSIPPETLSQALKALEHQGRLIRRERRHDVVVFEIISEFLVPWIARQKEERRTRAERKRAELRAKAQRRKWWAAIVVLALIALGSGTAAWFIYSYRTEAALKDDLVQQARDEARQAQLQLDRTEDAKALAETERDKAQTELDAIHEELDNEREQAEQQRSATERELADLRAQLAQQQDRAEALSMQVGTLSNQNNTLSEQAAKLTSDNERLKSEKGSLERQLQSSMGDYQAAAARNTRLQQQLGNLENQLQALQQAAEGPPAPTDSHKLRFTVMRGESYSDSPVTVVFSDEDWSGLKNPSAVSFLAEFTFPLADAKPEYPYVCERAVRGLEFMQAEYVRVLNYGTNAWDLEWISLEVDGKAVLLEVGSKEEIENFNALNWDKRSYWEFRLAAVKLASAAEKPDCAGFSPCYKQAVEFYKRRRLHSAALYFEAAIADDPKAGKNKPIGMASFIEYFPYYYVGLTYERLARPAEARSNFEKALAHGELTESRAKEVRNLMAQLPK